MTPLLDFNIITQKGPHRDILIVLDI